MADPSALRIQGRRPLRETAFWPVFVWALAVILAESEMSSRPAYFYGAVRDRNPLAVCRE
jgi:hypothetical protein